MDVSSSGEELLLKTRKPYTITKQRERWTDEEHNRFLEALKLYGRAWQRIEEHIGTKTAVQIRSHAQKFFSKLEKEAITKGIPVGKAIDIDIDIPPPRPKRKPIYPYPRKTGGVSPTTTQTGVTDGKQLTSASSHPDDHALDLEREPSPEEPMVNGREGDSNEKHYDGRCNRTFVPFQEKHVNKGKSSEPQVTDGTIEHRTSDGSGADETTQVHGSESVTEATRNFPRHVPVHILDGSLATCSQAISSDVSYQESVLHQMGFHTHPALFHNPTGSATEESRNSASRSSTHHKFPALHPPFTPFVNSQEHYNSFLQMSSAFSSLLVSTLQQNPAAHAAASFAASYWHSPNAGASEQSVPGVTEESNPGPSMAALVAATVAAATAWWAAHGLLPMCATPFNMGFSCSPASKMADPPSKTDQATAMEHEKEAVPEGDRDDQELSEANSPPISVSDSGGSLGAKMNCEVIGGDDDKMLPAVTHENDESQVMKNTKQVDRSSCDSNMASSSDIETDALAKHDKAEEDTTLKELNVSNSQGECSNRCSRNIGTINDSWKEVSEEGRMAFQALFLREVLPQSFWPPHDLNKKEDQNISGEVNEQNKKVGSSETLLVLHDNSGELHSNHNAKEKNETRMEEDEKETLLTLALAPSKLKTRRTGFKPYKRCSTEARETRLSSGSGCQDLKNGPKRLRLEGETST